jgi:hypothetical protein
MDNSGGADLITIFHAEGSSTAEMEALRIQNLLQFNGIATVMVGDAVLPNLPFEIKVSRDDVELSRQLIAEAQRAASAGAQPD